MAFSHSTGGYNVTSTVKNWLYQQIVANQPPLISTVVVKADWPEEGIAAFLPCWSVVWMGDVGTGQPNRSGDQRTGLLDVSCWVSRSSGSWMARVEQMQDSVMKAVATLRETSGSAIVLRDFYTSNTAPPAVGARVIVDRAERRMPPTDPNPDIERRRVVLYITWFET